MSQDRKTRGPIVFAFISRKRTGARHSPQQYKQREYPLYYQYSPLEPHTQFCFPNSTLPVSNLYIPRIGLPIVLQSNREYINDSQIHKCRNWERGRAVSFLEKHQSDFRYSAHDDKVCPPLYIIHDVLQTYTRMSNCIFVQFPACANNISIYPHMIHSWHSGILPHILISMYCPLGWRLHQIWHLLSRGRRLGRDVSSTEKSKTYRFDADRELLKWIEYPRRNLICNCIGRGCQVTHGQLQGQTIK